MAEGAKNQRKFYTKEREQQERRQQVISLIAGYEQADVNFDRQIDNLKQAKETAADQLKDLYAELESLPEPEGGDQVGPGFTGPPPGGLPGIGPM